MASCKAILISGFIWFLIAWGCTFVTNSLNYWSYSDVSGVKVNFGAWTYCVETTGVGKTCGSLNDWSLITSEQLSKINGMRAMIVLALIAFGASFGMSISMMCNPQRSRIFGIIVGSTLAAAGLFLMIAMALFIDLKGDVTDSTYGVSFAMDVTAWICAWVASAHMFLLAYYNRTQGCSSDRTQGCSSGKTQGCSSGKTQPEKVSPNGYANA